MEEHILNWLKNKLNYIYYDVESDTMNKFNQRLNHNLFLSKVSISDLEASSCYFVQKKYEVIDFKMYNPTHYKNNFLNFNLKFREYLFDFSTILDAEKNISFSGNDKMYIELLWRVLNENSYDGKIVPINDDMIKVKKTLKQFLDCDFWSIIQNNEFYIDDFRLRELDSIKKIIRSTKEIGIFYPFEFEHDVFENKYYLFEINHLRFFRNNIFFQNIVKNFYDFFDINKDKNNKLFYLSEYFEHTGFQYYKCMAYIDPFKNLDKYKNEYIILEKFLNLKKINFSTFVHELFELLNYIQIAAVKFQHETLINELLSRRSKNRKYTFTELIERKIEEIENINFSNEKSYILDIHYFLKDISRENKLTKNSKLTDCSRAEHLVDFFVADAQVYFDRYILELNNNESSSLNYINDQFNIQIRNLVKKYQLQIVHKKIIENMVWDLILFYKDKNKEKLSRPFNSTIQEIYSKNEKIKIDSIINYNFQKEFTQKYSYMFNKYR
ncbi:MAG: hypothetical protein WC149_06965 [Arcobacteraceae bacterium]